MNFITNKSEHDAKEMIWNHAIQMTVNLSNSHVQVQVNKAIKV